MTYDRENYATAQELRGIAALAEKLTMVYHDLRDQDLSVDFDNIQVSDSNGEYLTVLTYEGGEFVANLK